MEGFSKYYLICTLGLRTWTADFWYPMAQNETEADAD